MQNIELLTCPLRLFEHSRYNLVDDCELSGCFSYVSAKLDTKDSIKTGQKKTPCCSRLPDIQTGGNFVSELLMQLIIQKAL